MAVLGRPLLGRPLLAASILGMLLLDAAAAHAVSYTDVDKCQLLLRDFRRESYFALGPAVDEARKIRDEAAALCKKGDAAEGVQRMIDAFNKAGIKLPEY